MTDLVLVSANAVSASLDAFIVALVGNRPPDQTLHGVGYSGCVGIDVYSIPDVYSDRSSELRLNIARPAHLEPIRLYSRATALIGFIDPGEPLDPLADRMSTAWRHASMPSAIVCVADAEAPAPEAVTQISPGDSAAARRVLADLLAA